VREVVRLMRADLWPAIESGKLSSDLQDLPLDRQFVEALAVMRANQHFGKIRRHRRMK